MDMTLAEMDRRSEAFAKSRIRKFNFQMKQLKENIFLF
jgi:hypothetical protein